MCAAYDPNGAIIVCGGGPRFWRPSNNCWQLVKVRNCLWIILDLHDKCVFRVSQEPGQKYHKCIQFMELQQLSIGENSGSLEDQQVGSKFSFHPINCLVDLTV